MKDSYLDTQPLAKHRVWNLASDTLEDVHDVEFDETKGSQHKNENLKAIRGIQLLNAMKNMDIGKLRPRQVNDEEDDVLLVHGWSEIKTTR